MLIDFSFSKNSTSMKHCFRKKSFGVIVDMARYSMDMSPRSALKKNTQFLIMYKL